MSKISEEILQWSRTEEASPPAGDGSTRSKTRCVLLPSGAQNQSPKRTYSENDQKMHMRT